MKKTIITLSLILLLTLAGCKPKDSTPTTEQDAAVLIMTAAAGTAEALGISLETEASPTAIATETPVPAATETPTYMAIAIVESNTLNMREGPGTFFKITSSFNQGDRVTTLEMTPDGSWIKVAADSRAQGWMAATFLDLTALETALPIVSWQDSQTIYGTVLDQDGNPVTAARIAAVIATETGELRAEAISTADGNFAIYTPPGLTGPFNLEIVALNCGSNIAEVQPDGSCKTEDYYPIQWKQAVYLPQTQAVRFTYERGIAFLDGQVVYQDGNGASQILVRATRQSDGVQSEFVTPQGGKFRLPLGTGTWDVVAVRFMQDGTPLVSETRTYVIKTPGQALEQLTIPYIEIIER